MQEWSIVCLVDNFIYIIAGGALQRGYMGIVYTCTAISEG